MGPAQAMVLAAGLGTRLRPVTDRVPKPLFPLANRPILERNLELLFRHGFDTIVVNAFHLATQVVRLVEELARRWGRRGERDLRLQAVREEELLDTGGGIGHASHLFRSDLPLLVLNSDIFISFSPRSLLALHSRLGGAATLLLHRRPGLERVHMAGEGSRDVVGFGPGGHMAFTGAYCLSPSIISMLPKDRPCSIIEVFNRAMAAGMKVVAAFPHEVAQDGPFLWEDIGTPRGYLAAHHLYLRARGRNLLAETPLPQGVEVRDWAVVGRGCRIGERAVLERAVLWDGVEVEAGEHLRDVALTPHGRLHG